MSLAGTEIIRALDSGVWKAYRDGERVQAPDLNIAPNTPHSVDVTLQSTLLRVLPALGLDYIDPRQPDSMETIEIEMDERGYVLTPGDFVLGAVRERFDCSAALAWGCWDEPENAMGYTYFHGVYDGRSSVGRISISSHQCAGFLDWGFDGNTTLEISALVPVLIFPGMRIGQISFNPIQGVPLRYAGAYTDQYGGPRAARLGADRF